MDHGAGDRLLTLGRLFERAFQRYSDRIAIQFRERELTYAELDRQTATLANAYRALGLTADDRLGILMANRPEFLVGHIAAIRSGVTVVPLNCQLDDEEVRTLLRSADLHTLLVDEVFFDIVHDIQQETQALNYVIGHDTSHSLPIGFNSLAEMIDRADSEPPAIETEPDDIASLYYSSGTTGEPKGILHTHRSLVLNAFAHVQELDICQGEKMLLTTPLAHSAEPFARAALAQGAMVVLQQGFESSRFLQALEGHTITWTYLVPTMIAQLVSDSRVDETDTTSLETLVYGAAPISKPILEDGIERFGQVFVQFYGLTEVPNLISVLPKSAHDLTNEAALDSAGYPTQLVEVSIVEDAAPWSDDVGEIAVRSSYALSGYTTEETAFEDAGWLRTGDVGRIDDGGRLHVLDRLQDVILRDGDPVYSTTVESAIQRHPDVRQVGVIGVPQNGLVAGDDPPDQLVKAVVVPRDDQRVDLDDIQTFCREHIGQDLPDSVDVVGRLPETPYGKIDKEALRDPYW